MHSRRKFVRSMLAVCAVTAVTGTSAIAPAFGAGDDNKPRRDKKLKRNDGGGQTQTRAGGLGSVDEATNYIYQKFSGARILKIDPQQRNDRGQVVRFKILTQDGRMKNVNVPIK